MCIRDRGLLLHSIVGQGTRLLTIPRYNYFTNSLVPFSFSCNLIGWRVSILVLISIASTIDTLCNTINGYEFCMYMELEVQCTCMYDPNKWWFYILSPIYLVLISKLLKKHCRLLCKHLLNFTSWHTLNIFSIKVGIPWRHQ